MEIVWLSFLERPMDARKQKIEFKSLLRCIKKDKQTRSEQNIHLVEVVVPSNVADLVISASKILCHQTVMLRKVECAVNTAMLVKATTTLQCPEAAAMPVVAIPVKVKLHIKEAKVQTLEVTT